MVENYQEMLQNESNGFIRHNGIRIISVDEVGASKREPTIYHHAREVMGTDKALTWGFEDSLYAMDTLEKAGYPVLGLYDEAHGVPKGEVEKRARMTVPSLECVAVQEGELRLLP